MLSPVHLRRGAALLSAVAGLVHVAVAPDHWAEWWGYGLFFLVVAGAQLAFALILLKRPARVWIAAGILGNALVVALYVVTRTVGIPVGPEAGAVEAVAAIDLLSKGTELLLIALLGALLAFSRNPVSNPTVQPCGRAAIPMDASRHPPRARLETPSGAAAVIELL